MGQGFQLELVAILWHAVKIVMSATVRSIKVICRHCQTQRRPVRFLRTDLWQVVTVTVYKELSHCLSMLHRSHSLLAAGLHTHTHRELQSRNITVMAQQEGTHTDGHTPPCGDGWLYLTCLHCWWGKCCLWSLLYCYSSKCLSEIALFCLSLSVICLCSLSIHLSIAIYFSSL